MTANALTPLLHYVRRFHGAAEGPACGDGRLLERFALGGEEAAFEALLRRHGPMVLGVCRRLLRDAHAAEDAFQATFLVLVRKAGALRRPCAPAPGRWPGRRPRPRARRAAAGGRRRAPSARVAAAAPRRRPPRPPGRTAPAAGRRRRPGPRPRRGSGGRSAAAG